MSKQLVVPCPICKAKLPDVKDCQKCGTRGYVSPRRATRLTRRALAHASGRTLKDLRAFRPAGAQGKALDRLHAEALAQRELEKASSLPVRARRLLKRGAA